MMGRRNQAGNVKHIYAALCFAVAVLLAVVTSDAFAHRMIIADVSMYPSLQKGECVWLDRLSYRFRKPERGEIVIVKLEKAGKTVYYARRVAGLPGEQIAIRDGRIYINGDIISGDGFGVFSVGGDAENEMTLDDQSYFLVGDNERASDDSRQSGFGTVNKKNIYARVWR